MILLNFALVLTLWSGVQGFPVNKKADVALEFVILHNNDMHARFEQTSQNSGPCTKQEAEENKCYGGFPRVAHEVRKYREESLNGGPPVMYLNAGDTYTGTPWFTVFKDNITSAFLNKLQPDAVSLGNHEFDEGVSGLVPFLNKAKFPILAANLDLSKTPEMAATKSLKHYTLLDVNGIKVGVIGYITPETANLVIPNDVQYLDEIESINKEAAKLTEEGVSIIIALGHSGYEKDQEIARKCPDVDIVIGGHSHSFLYSGTPPDAESPEGPYPTIVKKPNGVEVPVVQSYAYTKYLGKMHVQFDKDGNLIEFDGKPILLNASVPRERDFLQLLDVYRPNISALQGETIGNTRVYLEGSSTVCRKGECNLGNLVADSMVHARVLEDQGGTYWTDAAIAVLGGGGIRNSIAKRSDGSITGADLLTVLPFGNELVVTKLLGKTLRKALERSAYLRDRDSNGGFLQMSGIHVTYDFEKEEGSRVVDVQVRCAECEVPHYQPLNETHLYKMVVQKFLFEHGDGHTVSEPNVEPIPMKMNDIQALKAYVQQRQIIYPENEGRIKYVNAKKSSARLTCRSSFLVVLLAFVLRNFF